MKSLTVPSLLVFLLVSLLNNIPATEASNSPPPHPASPMPEGISPPRTLAGPQTSLPMDSGPPAPPSKKKKGPVYQVPRSDMYGDDDPQWRRRRRDATAAAAAIASGGGGGSSSAAAAAATGNGDSSASATAAAATGGSGGRLISMPGGSIQETVTTEVKTKSAASKSSGGGFLSGLSSFGGALKSGVNDVIKKPASTLMSSAGDVSAAAGSTVNGVTSNAAAAVAVAAEGTGSVAAATGAGVVNTVSDLGSGIVKTGGSLGSASASVVGSLMSSGSSGGSDTIITKTVQKNLIQGAPTIIQTAPPQIIISGGQSSKSTFKETKIIEGTSGGISSPIVVSPPAVSQEARVVTLQEKKKIEGVVSSGGISSPIVIAPPAVSQEARVVTLQEKKKIEGVVSSGSGGAPMIKTVAPQIISGGGPTIISGGASTIKETKIIEGVSGSSSTPIIISRPSTIMPGTTPSGPVVVQSPKTQVLSKSKQKEVIKVQSGLSSPTLRIGSGGLGTEIVKVQKVEDKLLKKDVYIKQSSSGGVIVPSDTLVIGGGAGIGQKTGKGSRVVEDIIQSGAKSFSKVKDSLARGGQIASDIFSPTVQGMKESASRADRYLHKGSAAATATATAAATGGKPGSSMSSAAAAVSIASDQKGRKVTAAAAAAAASSSGNGSGSSSAAAASSTSSTGKGSGKPGLPAMIPRTAQPAKPKAPCKPLGPPPPKVQPPKPKKPCKPCEEKKKKLNGY